MKKHDNEDLIRRYIKSAVLHGEATYKGDYKIANSEAKQLTKIYRIMEQDIDLANVMLNHCLVDKDVSVKTWASAHALGLNIRINEAESVLKKVSVQKDIGILGFNAEMTLKAWKEQGYLRF